MPHDITDTDAMFSVRQATWHGLGEILPEYPTREEAQQIAHPWEPVSEPVYRRVPVIAQQPDGLGGYAEFPDVEYQEIEGHQAIVRSDNGATLGVLGDGYQPVSNTELWDIAEAVQASGADVKYETAGSLAGGRKVWVLLTLDEPVYIKGDPNGATLMHYALQNAHDGSAAFRGQATNVRIVCANTSQMADLSARASGTEFTFRHTANIYERIEGARDALSGWRRSVEEYQMFSEHLLGRTADEYERVDFLERFIPSPPPGAASERVMRNVWTAREQWTEILTGPTCEGIDKTAYGLVQASIEWTEHVRAARSQESRFQRSYLSRNAVVSSAVKIAEEVTT